MIIAIDYDGTYTEDPIMWDNIIKEMQKREHTVICVTMRYDGVAKYKGIVQDESKPVKKAFKDKNVNIYFTARQAKREFLTNIGISPNIWIDDQPLFIYSDAA